MALSDLTVWQAKAAEKSYSIPVTNGLGLAVAPTGGKSWHLRYYRLGKQKRISLSVQAIEIVRYLLGVMRPAQKHLLAHRSELKKRISENTLNAALKRLGYDAQLTGHGIRGRGTPSNAPNERVWALNNIS